MSGVSDKPPSGQTADRMRRYIFRRLLQNVFLLWVLTSLMFILFRILPGDPVSDHPVARAVGRVARGGSRILGAQSSRSGASTSAYIVNLLQGEFGISFHYQRPVWDGAQ